MSGEEGRGGEVEGVRSLSERLAETETRKGRKEKRLAAEGRFDWHWHVAE